MAQQNTTAVTDVGTFIGDLDGGQFEAMLSAAISQAAAASVDWNRQAEVNVKLRLKPIEGTHQIHVEHTLTYKKPTEAGHAGEEAKRITTMHVGKFGKVTIAPENQMQFWKKTDAKPQE